MSLKALCRAALAVAALFALGAGAAQAQVAYTANTVTSVFYREFKKDGRFFVFNNPRSAAAFEQSGETGVGITRIGIGPNGETRLRRQRDGARAVPVQVRPHRRGAAAAAAAARRRLARRQDALHARQHLLPGDVQPHPAPLHARAARRAGPAPGHRRPRATARAASASAAPSSSSRAGSTSRARVRGPDQLARTSRTTQPASQFVEDANIDWDISKKKKFRVKFGQFKAPFGRQQLDVVRRPAVRGPRRSRTRATTTRRETGVALWGVLGGNKLDWRVMIVERQRPHADGRTTTTSSCGPVA